MLGIPLEFRANGGDNGNRSQPEISGQVDRVVPAFRPAGEPQKQPEICSASDVSAALGGILFNAV